ncbi:MAG: MerR family transcriptional regulator [Lachnospiraceae bacterium]|nr:MerR family transcriptional regulator [Lachnospiraceae bacterium]
MNIQEMEQATKLTRANIRYYEKEGLLNPEREGNGYRNYSEKDRDTLLKIKLLRELGVSLAEIRDLQAGKVDLYRVMEIRMNRTDAEMQHLVNAKELCEKICMMRVRYEELNAETYLVEWEQQATGTIEKDRLTGDVKPWHRYFARLLDLNVYGFLFLCVRTFFLKWYPTAGVTTMDSYALFLTGDILLATVAVLLIEPVLLSRFKTTLGKWLFGIRVQREDGKCMTYREALERTWLVWRKGMGLGIPLYSLARMWESRQFYEENGYVEWDKGIAHSFQKRKQGFLIVGYVAVIVVLTMMEGRVEEYAKLPKHRGEITLAEFADNVNGYKEYYATLTTLPSIARTEAGLDQYGNWVRVKQIFGVTVKVGKDQMKYINDEGVLLPSLTYQVSESGVLTQVRMECDWFTYENSDFYDYYPFVNVVAVAYLGAQTDVTVRSGGINQVLSSFTFNKDCSFMIGDVEVVYDYEESITKNKGSICLTMTKK